MTIGIAWVGERKDGREHLYIASDSRTRGAYTFDSCPKIMTLPRSDCALCFAGNTADTYPLMVQMAYAIAAHEPSRERSMDIARVKAHLLRLFTDLVHSQKTPAVPFKSDDAQFLFAGYSWLKKEFRIWTIEYLEPQERFVSRESHNFNSRLKKAAFIGDWATRLRSTMAKQLSCTDSKEPVYLEPLQSLCALLADAKETDTIGGPPQLCRRTAIPGKNTGLKTRHYGLAGALPESSPVEKRGRSLPPARARRATRRPVSSLRDNSPSRYNSRRKSAAG